MRLKYIWLSLVLTLALSACGGQSAARTPAPTEAPPAATAAPAQTPAPTPTPEPTLPPNPTAEAAALSVTPPPSAEVTAIPPEPTATIRALPPTPEPTTAEIPVPVEGGELGPEPTAEPVPTPEQPPEPSRPSDEEVLAAFREAEEAYRWFDMTTLPLDYTVAVPVGEETYYPVADERFPTMEALRSYLKTLFSDELVDGMLPLDGTHYLEVDGRLCALDAGRGSDVTKGALTLEVDWPEEPLMRCTVKGTVQLLDEDLTGVVGEQVYEFPYEKVGEKWVFTQFGSIF